MAKTNTDPMGAPLLPTTTQRLEQAPAHAAAAPKKLSKGEVRALFEELAENTTAPELRAEAPASEAAEYSPPRPLRVKNPTPLPEPPIVIRATQPDALQPTPRPRRALSTTVNTRPFRDRLGVRVAAMRAPIDLNDLQARLKPLWIRISLGLVLFLLLAFGSFKLFSASPSPDTVVQTVPSIAPPSEESMPTQKTAEVSAVLPSAEPPPPSSAMPIESPKRVLAATPPALRASTTRAIVNDAGSRIAPINPSSDLELGPTMKTSAGKYKEGM